MWSVGIYEGPHSSSLSRVHRLENFSPRKLTFSELTYGDARLWVDGVGCWTFASTYEFVFAHKLHFKVHSVNSSLYFNNRPRQLFFVPPSTPVTSCFFETYTVATVWVALLWYISVETVCWISTLQATRLQLSYGVMIAWTYAVWECRYFLCWKILTFAKTWHWEIIGKFSQLQEISKFVKFSNCSKISPLWNILHHYNEVTYLFGFMSSCWQP